MFVLNDTNEFIMFLLDGDGTEVATIHLDNPPHYRIFIHSGSISLDALEYRFKRNNYKCFDRYEHTEQFLIDFIDGKTYDLNVIEKLGKVCTVRSPVVTMVWCDEPDDIGTFSEYDIDFCIIASLTDEKKVKFYDINGLLNSKFDPRLETVVFIHGYQIWPFTSGHSLIKDYQDGKYNNIVWMFESISTSICDANSFV